MENLSNQLIKKSIEAFIMGLEIYNKPTIKYRIEGFSFFVCNAWELMLKGKMLNDGLSIYFKDNKDRTIDLSTAIKKVYTDKRQPLRVNLEKIVELRNTSTHFITEDYEIIFAPLFQANVMNFCEQIKRFHDIDITNYIAQNFLTLSVNLNTLNNSEIRSKYTVEMAEKLINEKTSIDNLIDNSTSNALFIPMKHDFYITNKKSEADLVLAVDKTADASIKIVTKLTDPSSKFKLSFNGVIKAINKQLISKNIKFDYTSSKGKQEFSTYTLTLFSNFYNIKNDEKYSYWFAGVYRYSQQLVDFIIEEIKKNPNLISDIIKANKKR